MGIDPGLQPHRLDTKGTLVCDGFNWYVKLRSLKLTRRNFLKFHTRGVAPMQHGGPMLLFAAVWGEKAED